MSKPTSADAPTVKIAKTYPGRGRLREFVVTVATEEVDRPRGFGLTLDEVLDGLAETFRQINEHDTRVTGTSDARGDDDHVVWELGRVVAVVRPDREGKALEVTRFDGPAD